MRKHASRLLALLLPLLAPAGEALADPITPWPGERTGTGTLQLVPILYVAGDASAAYPSLYASTGFGDAWDVYVGVWGIASREAKGFDLLDIFPRYHLGEETAVALRLQLTPGESFVVGGELHTNFSWDKVSLMLNTGVRPDFALTSGTLNAATVFALVAPEYHFTDQFSVYLEVDPALTAYQPFSGAPQLGVELALLPGLSYALDPDETQQFSVGVELALRRGEPVSLGDSLTFAAWYAVSFDLASGDTTAPSDESTARAHAAPQGSRRLGQRSGVGGFW
jgi:hypothetical protein